MKSNKRPYISTYGVAAGGLFLLLLFVTACGGASTAATTAPATATLAPQPPTLPTTLLAASPTAAIEPTATAQAVVVQRVERPTTEPAQLTTRVTPANLPTALPRLAAHLAAVRSVLAAPVPILPLPNVTEEQAQAQALALQDSRVLAAVYDQQTGAPLRNEVFGIYPVRPSDITPETATCAEQDCYRVEIYHYAYNASTIAIVNLSLSSNINSSILAVEIGSSAEQGSSINNTSGSLAMALAMHNRCC